MKNQARSDDTIKNTSKALQTLSKLILLNMLDEEVRVKLKEYACIQVNHHKEVPKAIADMQNLGWRLHTYQATGYGADVKHYLLFEKGD